MSGGHIRPCGKQAGQLRATQLSQPMERLYSGIRVDLDQAEPAAVAIAAEPVQDLEQLQLIIEIVLKPENDFLMFRGVFKYLIARGKTSAELFIVARAKAGKRLRPDIGKLAQRRGLGNRTVMQYVAPGKVRARKSDLPEGTNDRISVGDMQHRKRLSQP